MNDLNKALYQKIRNGDNFEVLKVLSFNVYFKAMKSEINICNNSKCLNNVKTFIESNDFDIICLQEASVINNKLKNDILTNTESKLKNMKTISIEYGKTPAYKKNTETIKASEEDMIILYNKTKLGNHTNVYYGFDYKKDGKVNNYIDSGRPIIVVEFNKLILISAHLSHFEQNIRNKNFTDIKLKKASLNNSTITNSTSEPEKIMDIFLNDIKPIIICGDFNTDNDNFTNIIKTDIDDNTKNKTINGYNINNIITIKTPNKLIKLKNCGCLDHILTSLPQSNYLNIYDQNKFTSFIKKETIYDNNNNELIMSDHLPVVKIILLDK